MMEYWKGGITGAVVNRCKSFLVVVLMAGFALVTHAFGQAKTIVIGEGVRGAMYLPAYIAEGKGFLRNASSIPGW